MMKNGSLELEARVFGAVNEIPKEEWEAIVSDKFRDYNFFKVVDTAGFKGLKHCYITVYDEARLVGAAPCFLFDYPFETTLHGPLKKLLGFGRRAFPAILNFRTLVCGLPGSEGRLWIDDGRKEDVLRTIIASMEEVAQNERAALIAFKDFTSEYTETLDCLTDYRFHKVESYPSVELNLNFSSFDEYMKGLSRATRKDLKRKFRKAANLARVKFEVVDDVRDILDDVYSLYRQTFLRSSVRFEEASKEFFRNISIHMPDRSKYFVWRIDGKVVAFNLCLVSEGILTDEYIGFDYPTTFDYHLYFLTFRDIINWCIANGVKKYKSGAMTYEPKKRLGCSFVPSYVYVRHMSGIVNPLFRFVCAALKPENHDEVLGRLKNKTIKRCHVKRKTVPCTKGTPFPL